MRPRTERSLPRRQRSRGHGRTISWLRGDSVPLEARGDAQPAQPVSRGHRDGRPEPGARAYAPSVSSSAPSKRPGMGALPYDGGTTFRVWAPHADAVFVTGTFDDWAGDRTPLAQDGDRTTGTWSADVPGVEVGAEYRFTIR